MKNQLLIILIIISNTSLCQKLLTFDDCFKKVREITFSDDLIIGNISYFDVFKENKYVITDPVSRKVIYLDKKSSETKLLNPEICTPGFKLNADYARFDKNGKIYVMNNIGACYIFDSNGNCLHPLGNYYHFPHITFLNSGEIVGYSNMGDGNHLKLFNESGKEFLRFGEFPEESKKAIQTFLGGGLVADGNDVIYQMNFNNSDVFVYQNKKLIKTLDSHIKNFNGFKTDIKKYTDPKSNIKQYTEIIDNYSFIVDLFLSDENTLLILSITRRKFFVQFISTDGKKYLNNPIELKRLPVCAKNGFVYFVEQPEPIGDKLPNPKVIVYKTISKL